MCNNSIESGIFFSLIHKENKISIHLAQKLGFIWQEEVKIHGKYLQRYTKSLQFGEKLSIM